MGVCGKANTPHSNDGHNQEAEIHQAENYLYVRTQDLLARGTELLKRTRKGVLSKHIFSNTSPFGNNIDVMGLNR